MKRTISEYCPNCKGGVLSFDYYNFQIRCLNCKAIWEFNEELMKRDREMEGKLMICSMYQQKKCNALICKRQKPHEYDIYECNILCEEIPESKCEEYNG